MNAVIETAQYRAIGASVEGSKKQGSVTQSATMFNLSFPSFTSTDTKKHTGSESGKAWLKHFLFVLTAISKGPDSIRELRLITGDSVLSSYGEKIERAMMDLINVDNIDRARAMQALMRTNRYTKRPNDEEYVDVLMALVSLKEAGKIKYYNHEMVKTKSTWDMTGELQKQIAPEGRLHTTKKKQK